MPCLHLVLWATAGAGLVWARHARALARATSDQTEQKETPRRQGDPEAEVGIAGLDGAANSGLGEEGGEKKKQKKKTDRGGPKAMVIPAGD